MCRDIQELILIHVRFFFTCRRMNKEKPGTGPVRKQKQRSHSHCPKRIDATSGVSSSSDTTQELPKDHQVTRKNKYKTKTYYARKTGNLDISAIEMQPMNSTSGENRVFNNDTQKSMCVKNKVGTSDSQISSDCDTISISSNTSIKSIRRKQNRANKRRRLAEQNKDREKIQPIEQTDKLDSLKSLIDLLALTIESQTYSLTSLNKYWVKYSGGLNVHCTCKRKHYPFSEFCDLELQVFCTYNYLVGLLDNQEEIVDETPKSKDSESLPKPLLDFSLSTDEETNDGRPKCVYDAASCVTPPWRKNTLLPHDKKMANVTRFANDLKFKLVGNSGADTVKVAMSEDKDMGYFKAGKGAIRRVKPEIAKALDEINQTFNGNEEGTSKAPLSRPVLDNLHIPNEAEEGEPVLDNSNGFKLRYKPAFWQFWRHKSSFNSERQFNHDAHFVRRVAKTKNLDYTNLPDDCVIDSLYSYLVRRRLPTYPNYNSKLEHLHKLAKAWESETMPLSKNIANAKQLNNYYLTIGKVANSTDIDMLLSQHHEDRLGRRARLFRWITGRTVQTVRED